MHHFLREAEALGQDREIRLVGVLVDKDHLAIHIVAVGKIHLVQTLSIPLIYSSNFFGGGGARGGQRRRAHPAYEISIDFMDAIKGVTREIHVPRGEAGEGSVKKTIKIPAGVDSGSRIRFDEFDLVISVKADKQFQREGDDIFIERAIPFSLAALGGAIEVPTVEEPVTIRIQPGTQAGTLIRLRGKGAPHVRGSGRGDQYVKIQLHVPTHLSRRQRELLSELEESNI